MKITPKIIGSGIIAFGIIAYALGESIITGVLALLLLPFTTMESLSICATEGNTINCNKGPINKFSNKYLGRGYDEDFYENAIISLLKEHDGKSTTR